MDESEVLNSGVSERHTFSPSSMGWGLLALFISGGYLVADALAITIDSDVFDSVNATFVGAGLLVLVSLASIITALVQLGRNHRVD